MYRLATKHSEINEPRKLFQSRIRLIASRKRKWHSVPLVARYENRKHFRCKQTMKTSST